MSAQRHASRKYDNAIRLSHEWQGAGKRRHNTGYPARKLPRCKERIDAATVRDTERSHQDVLQRSKPLDRPASLRDWVRFANDAYQVLREETLRPELSILHGLRKDCDPASFTKKASYVGRHGSDRQARKWRALLQQPIERREDQIHDTVRRRQKNLPCRCRWVERAASLE